MAHRTPDGRWRVRKRIRGRRISENFPTKAMADRFEAQLELARYQPVFQVPTVDAKPAASPLTFKSYAAQWLAEYCKVEKAETQHAGDAGTIDQYLNPAFGDVLLSDLTPEHLTGLRARLRTEPVGRNKRPLKPKSVNNVTDLAKKLLGDAAERGLVAVSPFRKVKRLKVGKQPFDFWLPDERDHFIRHARQLDPEFTRAVELACFTGLRLGEIAGLRRGDVDFDLRLIQVTKPYNYKLGKPLERPKGVDVETIPMNERAMATLQSVRLARRTALVFSVDVLDQARRKLGDLCKATGTREIRFHDLRHTFASSLVMAGVPIYTVQKLMRHKDPRMTERYAHLTPGYLREEAERICSPRPGPDLAPEALATVSSIQNRQ